MRKNIEITDMYTPRERTLAFYQLVKTDYSKLANKKESGVRVYSHEFIISRLAKKHFRSPTTIENIVFDRIQHVNNYLKKGA